MEAHKGSVSYSSGENHTGNIFCINMPVQLANNSDSDLHSIELHYAAPFGSPPGRLSERSVRRLAAQTVLVVDDAATNRTMLRRLLQPRFRRILEAVNGSKAVDAIATAMSSGETIDLVLMDYQMPVMDGPTAIRHIRELGYSGPIIGVTGNVLPEHVETMMSQGATAVLPKPLRMEALWKALRGECDEHTADVLLLS